MSITLDELLTQKAELVSELGKVNARIDAYRVKCPTCRCRILPDRTCNCCDDRVVTCDEPSI